MRISIFSQGLLHGPSAELGGSTWDEVGGKPRFALEQTVGPVAVATVTVLVMVSGTPK